MKDEGLACVAFRAFRHNAAQVVRPNLALDELSDDFILESKIVRRFIDPRVKADSELIVRTVAAQQHRLFHAGVGLAKNLMKVMRQAILPKILVRNESAAARFVNLVKLIAVGEVAIAER